MFTSEELQKIMAALDAATRAGGLNVAAELLPLAQKVNELMQAGPSDDLVE